MIVMFQCIRYKNTGLRSKADRK